LRGLATLPVPEKYLPASQKSAIYGMASAPLRQYDVAGV
jgi:hypothetical protein